MNKRRKRKRGWNWKIWDWARQARELRTVAALRNDVERLEAELGKLYQRTPAIVTEAQQKRANVERLMVLAGMRQDEPLWQVVLSYADEHARNEAATALTPNLGDAERQYNAGRAASAADFAAALRDLRLQAEAEARKRSRE